MKRILNLVLIAVFSLVNAFSFIGCRSVTAESEEVRACWVSSVGNLDFPSDMGLSAAKLKAEIDAIVTNCLDAGLNTIFLQVRPMGDALYQSEIFPWSVYLSGTQGVMPDGGFDPLAYFVKKAHAAGLELHAWINPYRIGAGANVWEKLSADNPAVLHPEYTVTNDSGVYYNPGHPEARKLILSGVSELVKNYEIDGIHFDDYFYPYDMEGFDDSAVYAQYGNGLSLADFRRESVNQLIEAVHNLVKTLNSNVQFGISPFGIWANQSVDAAGSDTSGMSSYSEIYSDSKKWVEQGWLDYVCPQIYWSFENEAAPYDVLVDWWDALCTKNQVKLYVGIALYKVGTDEAGWEQGTIMERQLTYAAKKESYAGHCFFRYGVMMENPLGALDSIRSYYGDETARLLRAASRDIEAEYTELQAAESLTVTSPQSGTSVSSTGISVSGTAVPGASVTVNGTAAVVSSKGFWSAYVSLSVGTNTLTVRSGSETRSVRVIRKSGQTDPLKLIDASSAYPTGEVHRNAGDVITFEVDGPAGASVTLANDSVAVSLKASADDPQHYTGTWTVPAFPAADKLTLDGFSYHTTLNGVTATAAADLTLVLYSGGYRQELTLGQDAYIFDESRGGSQMDHDPLPQGTQVTVIGREGERLLLDNGYWIQAETAGEEQVAPTGTANYNYEILTVSSREAFGYSSYCDGSQLTVRLAAGRMTKFEVDTEQNDFEVAMKQTTGESVLSITSRSGRTVAGYEILPQKGRITVCLRYHTAGLSGKTIFIDAGHGGKDTGALGPGGSSYPTESELNLLLAGALADELKAAGATVLLTRSTDKTVTLAERAENSVKLAPDLFISLHHNSTDQTANFNSASGGMVLYSSPVSESLAQSLSEVLWDEVGEKQAVCRRQSLYVCRQTRFPAVLVEAGYLCNPLEYEMLCREDIARKIAKNMVKGLENYFVTVCS